MKKLGPEGLSTFSCKRDDRYTFKGRAKGHREKQPHPRLVVTVKQTNRELNTSPVCYNAAGCEMIKHP